MKSATALLLAGTSLLLVAVMTGCVHYTANSLDGDTMIVDKIHISCEQELMKHLFAT